MKSTLATIITLLTISLVGCDNRDTYEEHQEKVQKSEKEIVQLLIDQHLNPALQEARTKTTVTEAFYGLSKTYNESIDGCTYALSGEKADVITEMCINAIDRDGTYARETADTLNRGLSVSDPSAIIALYSYNYESPNKLTALIKAYKVQYINTLNNLAKSTTDDNELLYLAGVENIKGEFMVKNAATGLDYLYNSWLSGNVKSAKLSSITYSRMNDKSNAYFWALRCINECHNAVVDSSDTMKRSEEFEQILTVEEIRDIQHLAAKNELANIQ